MNTSAEAQPPATTARVAIVVALLSLAGSAGASYVAYQASQNTSNVEMVKLAVSVIQSEESPVELRKWAIDALATHGKVPITPEQKEKMAVALDDETRAVLEQVEAKNDREDLTPGNIVDFASKYLNTMIVTLK